MGFVLTIIYVVLTILSPEQFGSDLASLHVLEILAAAIVLVSLPRALADWRTLCCKQTLLLFGLLLAIGLSRAANGWAGGALQSWMTFLPSAAAFFLIILTLTTPRRLKILALALVAACLFVCVEGLCGYYGGFRDQTFVAERGIYQGGQLAEQFGQLRGLGFLNDPNDFSQILLMALPLAFFAWRREEPVHNMAFVYIPVSIMLWAIYLTHSRGALLGLAVLALMVVRKRIPTSASLVLVTIFVAGMLALNFTGGRGISIEDGGDRLEAWSNGMEMFKKAPVFGIGFGAFGDFNDITAHNSLVLCLAELGLVGSTLWIALLVSTTVDLNKIIGQQAAATSGGDQIINPRRPEIETEDLSSVPKYWPATSGDDTMAERQSRDEPEVVSLVPTYWARTVSESGDQATPSQQFGGKVETISLPPTYWTATANEGDAYGIAAVVEPSNRTMLPLDPDDETEAPLSMPTYGTELMRLALIAFMTTSWFLSRCYSPTMYLILGLTTATVILQPLPAKNQNRNRWVLLTIAAEMLGIALIYAVVRLHWGSV